LVITVGYIGFIVATVETISTKETTKKEYSYSRKKPNNNEYNINERLQADTDDYAPLINKNLATSDFLNVTLLIKRTGVS
jgi:sortase (surface protein transpeptidase)